MSKTIKQKAAEEELNHLVYTGDDLSEKDWKKICVAMYEAGYNDGIFEAENKINALLSRLTY